MGETAERNQWYKGKAEILRDHVGKHSMLQDAVAARGFQEAPGYLAEAVTDLEQATKLRLSTLNYEIVKAAVEREIQQTGHDYDIAYKEARIAFELEKSQLLTALQQEYADLEYTMALKEQEVEYLAVEAFIRSLTLITLRAAIKEEREALEQELINVKRLPYDTEIRLIQAKQATVEAKLMLIPYLENIIDAGQRLLTQEEINIGYKEDEIQAREALVDNKEALLSVLDEKAGATMDLADAITEEIEFRKERLAIALKKAEANQDKAQNEKNHLETEAAIEALRDSLNQARATLRARQNELSIELIGKDTEGVTEIAEKATEISIDIDETKEAAAGYRQDKNLVITDITNRSEQEANKTHVDAETRTLEYIENQKMWKTIETARIAAAARITSELIHILSS